MTRMPTIESKTGLELISAGEHLLTKRMHLGNGLLQKQRLTCANHSDEEILLVQIGWQSFICPKCGSDYSIGRKVVVLDPKSAKTYNLGISR